MFGCCDDSGRSVWHGVCDDVVFEVCGLCLGVVVILVEVSLSGLRRRLRPVLVAVSLPCS